MDAAERARLREHARNGMLDGPFWRTKALALLDELENAQKELDICRESYAAMTKGWLATCAERDALRAELETARAEHKTLLAGFSRLALDNAKHWIERDSARALLREVDAALESEGWGKLELTRASIAKHLGEQA
jgi:hypothetical protein